MSIRTRLAISAAVALLLVADAGAQSPVLDFQYDNFAPCAQPSFSTPGPGGPGTEMTKIINRLGLGSDCGRCKALANQMDRCGVAWVQQNRQYVVQRTIKNAENLGHRMGPVNRMGVRVIVRRAVRKAR